MRKTGYALGAILLFIIALSVILPDPTPKAKETRHATQTPQVVQTQTPAQPDPIPTGNPPDQTVSADRPVATPKPQSTPVVPAPKPAAPIPPAAPAPEPDPAPVESNDVYYATCADAPGPVYRDDPGYRSAMDRDKDGVACESN